nr:hypothetical protein [Tanacetum cinerariifolium]
MQKRRNDVKARTTLLLALPDEHQLRFRKYETAKELWEAILKTFGGNEATKKTKKNQLKQQYGNFKAEGSETLEQTFNRLQAIVSHLEFMDVEIEQDDLNQKFLTSLAPEWLIGKGEVHTASTQVSTASTDVAAASLGHDTVCAYIASQSNGSQIKYEDITQIDEDDIEEIDIKWNMALLSMMADRFWKKTGKKITIEGSDVAGFDKSKNHALVADDEALTEFALMAKPSSSSENEVEARLVEFKEQEIKFCEKIKGLERDVEVRNNKIEYLMNELEQVKKEKEGLDNKLTGLPEFVDDSVTDYSRPTPSIDTSKCNSSDLQSSNISVSEHGESSDSIMSKPIIKFVKAADCPRVTKTNNTENARKSTVKYAEMYRNTSKSPKVRGNQQNWNNLKSQQLGKDFLMQNKACFKCGYFDHLASDCGVWVEKEETRSKNNFDHKNVTHRAVLLKIGKTPIAVSRLNMNVAQPKMTSFAKTTHSNVKRHFQGKSAVRTQPRVPRVSTVDSKFLTVKSTFTTDLGNKRKAVKASACWIWRPKQNTTEQGPNYNGVSVTFKKY